MLLRLVLPLLQLPLPLLLVTKLNCNPPMPPLRCGVARTSRPPQTPPLPFIGDKLGACSRLLPAARPSGNKCGASLTASRAAATAVAPV